VKPIAKPGSTMWLLLNMMRINWRQRRTSLNLVGPLLLWSSITIVWLLLHGFAFFLFYVDTRNAADAHAETVLHAVSGIMFWLACGFMLLLSLPAAAAAMFERNNLELLLASPVSTRSILIVLGLTIAANSVALPAFFLTPFVNIAAVFGHPSLLAAYPVLAAAALLITALSMLVMLGLIAWLGVPRARKFARVAGLLLVTVWVIGTQVNALLQQKHAAVVHARHVAWQPGTWLTVPGALVSGAPVLLLAFCGVAFAAFVGVVTFLQQTYLAGMGQADDPASSKRSRKFRYRWRAGLLQTVLWKEWRLIYRDPQLLSQIFLQVIGLVFGPMLLVQQFHVDIVMVLGVVVIVTGGMLSEVLAWLVLSAEDAPALLASAPVSRTLLIRYKMLAAQLPVWVLAVPAFGYMVWHRPLVAVGVAVMFVGATASTAAVMLWTPVAGSRHMRLAKRKRSLLDGLIVLLTVIGWAFAAYGVGSAHWVVMLSGVVVGLIAPLIARWRGMRREFALGY
jgi:ABC-2 type transport system permease protein